MLTDLMGGELKVRSTPGEGTVFTVRLLLSEVHGAVVRKRAAPVFTGYEGPRRRVLVVDNEEADRELLQRWLQPLGFEVQLATSGHDALALLEGSGARQRAGAAMPCFWTWPCPASTAGKRCGVCARVAGAACRWPSCRPTPSTRGWWPTASGAAVHSPPDFFVKPVRRDDLLDVAGRRCWT